MFSFFKKDLLKELNKQYMQKLEEAMHAQHNGDIRSYSILTSDAEDNLKKIESLDPSKKKLIGKSSVRAKAAF